VGINQAAKFQTALDGYSTVLSATETALNASGSATEEWAIRATAAAEQIDRFKVSIENLLRTIGDQFKDQLTGTIGATTDLSSAFKELVESGALQPLFDQLGPLLEGLTEDIKAVAEALPEAFEGLDLEPVTAGFEAIGDAVSALFGNVDLTTAEGLRAVLQDLVNIGGGFLQVTAGIIEGLTPLIQGIGELGENFGKLNPETQQSAGNLLGIGTSANFLLGFVGPLTDGISALGLGLQAVAGASIVRTLTELGSAAASASTSVSGLASVVGRAGLVGAVGLASYELASWADLNDKLIPGVDTLGTKIFEWLNPQEKLTGAVQATTEVLDDMVTAEDRAADATAATVDAVRQSADANADRADNIGMTADELDAAIALEQEFEAAIAQEAENIAQADAALTDKAETTRGYRAIIDEATGAVVGFEQVGKSIASTAQDGAEALGLEAEKAAEFALELEKLASNERIALIEAKVALDTAELEAATEVTLASFESINTGIESTGDLLGKLFGALGEADSIRERFNIEKQIELETVDGANLQVELEQFMYRLFDLIQIRATEEGAEFLLGLG